MKQCPFCKAELEENARFCLYCMTSLEKKQNLLTTLSSKKRWKYILSAFLVMGILFACVLFIPRCNLSSSTVTPTVSPLGSNEIPVGSSPNSILNHEGSLSHEAGYFNNIASQGGTPQTGNSSIPAPTVSVGIHGSSTSPFVSNTSGDSYSAVSSTIKNPTTSSSFPVPSVIVPPPVSSQSSSQSAPTVATYTYRTAKYGDDFAVSTDMTNRIVITGVKTTSSNGVYTIPSTIDGKQVLSIMSNAFDDVTVRSTVKTVIVPQTVKTIWNNAFSACYNLTDIYLCGSSIYIEPYAFANSAKRNGTLTIHCSSSCNDRNFRYYKNTASSYGAVYQEWNG